MQRIAIIAYTARESAVKWAFHAAERFVAEGAQVYLEDGLAELAEKELLDVCSTCSAVDFRKYADIVVTFGGDGTLLGTAHLLIGSDVPIMGVNVGKLGFLAEYPVSFLDDSIMQIVKGHYRVVDRSTLEVVVDGQSHFALNEILVDQASDAGLLELKAFVNDHHTADYRADGVLVATPTGSTAYSLAAGGPIIAPSATVLCITPISPHTLTLRPLIVSDDSEIRFLLVAEDSEATIVADGHVVGRIKTGETVTIRRSEHLVKLVKRADSTYYDLLREKLLWSVDAIRK